MDNKYKARISGLDKGLSIKKKKDKMFYGYEKLNKTELMQYLEEINYIISTKSKD